MRDEAKRRVLEATDVVELIGQHVALRPRGKEMLGLCPFHDDARPSLHVSPTKQIFKCFACGAGGDALSFVMRYHRMSFPEALSHLAERAHIELPRRRGEGGGGDAPGKRQRILEANQRAADYYRRILRDERLGAAARAYLGQRGIGEEMVERFGIGCAPDRWDGLVSEVQRRGWDRQAFELAGLIAQRPKGGGHYDRLRHRLVFPILDAIARPIAFGGRVLPGGSADDASGAKYLNSPEHEAFNKSATLFGLHAAHRPMIETRTAIVVEGYTDVIAAHQAGAGNVVATLGTALTPDHARLLRRYCDRVVLVFDADEAGQRAADRALGVFFREPLDIDIAVLPDGMDPADLLGRADGPQRWRAALEGAVDAMSFQLERLRRTIESVDTMAGRQRLTEAYLRSLDQLGLRRLDRQRYGLVFARLGELLGMSPGAVQQAMHRMGAATPARAAEPGPAPRPPTLSAEHAAEHRIIGCLLSRPELFDHPMPDGRPFHEWLVPQEFSHEELRRLYHALYEWLVQRHAAGDAIGELKVADLREIAGEEALVHLALDAQMEAERHCGSEAQRLAEHLTHHAAAVVRRRAERDYQQRKQQWRDRRADAADGERRAVEERELLDAIAHVKAHPSHRVPRPIG